jgi:hypothetical protein
MDNAKELELEDVLSVLERHQDYLDFKNAVRAELKNSHEKPGFMEYGRTVYGTTTVNAVVSDVLSQIDWIEKVWKYN